MLNISYNSYEIGKRIKKARDKKRYTQEQLAELISVSRVTISQWENGTRSPSKENASKLCKILAVDSGFLNGDYTETNYNNHKISELTRLSENSIDALEKLSDKQISVLDEIIKNPKLANMLNQIIYRNDPSSIVSFTISKGGLSSGKQKGNPMIVYPWNNYEDYRNSIDFQITKQFNEIIDGIK